MSSFFVLTRFTFSEDKLLTFCLRSADKLVFEFCMNEEWTRVVPKEDDWKADPELNAGFMTGGVSPFIAFMCIGILAIFSD